MMNKQPDKEQVKEAISTLVAHYGRKFFQWLNGKCPKLVGTIAGAVICAVGGILVYFLLAVSGQDPIDFVFGILSEKSAEVQTNEVIEISYSTNDCKTVDAWDDTNAFKQIEYKKEE